MHNTLPARFLPAATLALLIGLLLQLLMQALIDTPVPVRKTPSAVEVNAFVAPPPPATTRTTATVKPDFPVKPPAFRGDITIPPVTPPDPKSTPTEIYRPSTPQSSPSFDPASIVHAPILPDTPARTRSPLRPPFPPEAIRRSRSGQVTAAFTVGIDGRVTDIEIEQVEPRGLGFERSVRRVLRGAVFVPANVEGRATSSRLRQNFVFELDGQ
ncbi:MAG: TonB family protein [Gammaproteobacteria bacterium]